MSILTLKFPALGIYLVRFPSTHCKEGGTILDNFKNFLTFPFSLIFSKSEANQLKSLK